MTTSQVKNVVHKIETIKSIFLNTQQFYVVNNPTVLLEYLESIKPEFRSIGYEAASMAIAVHDFYEEKELNSWLSFANGPALKHKAQVHVGLGWAMAKLKFNFFDVVENIEKQLYYRIADGCGYYDGFFRNRHTVINQEFPDYMPFETKEFYYQGIGRSLWYSAQGDIEKVRNIIESFPTDLHTVLWRGIGLAVAYVGGCDAGTLSHIFESATLHQAQLASGAALAARSRMDANTITSDTTICSQFWFQLCIEKKIISIDKSATDNKDVYQNWILKTEKDLSGSFK